MTTMARWCLWIAALLLATALLASWIVRPAHAQEVYGPVTPIVSASAVKGMVLKAGPGHLYAVYATNVTSTAGFLVLLNATAIPSDGAITPLACAAIPATGTVSLNYVPSPPALFSTGITAAVTSASTCYTLTTGVITAYFSGLLQ